MAPQKPHLHRCVAFLRRHLKRTETASGGLSQETKDIGRPPTKAKARAGIASEGPGSAARHERQHRDELGGEPHRAGAPIPS